MSSEVVANCAGCGDKHALGDRRPRLSTDDAQTCHGTACPACDSPKYTSEFIGEYSPKAESERIADIARPAGGVGTKNLQNLLDTYDFYVEFEAATVSDLKKVEGIGQQTAENIVDRRDGVTS